MNTKTKTEPAIIADPLSFPPPKSTPKSAPKTTKSAVPPPVSKPVEPGIIPAATAPVPKGPRTEAPPGCPYKVGVRINHQSFGPGVVKSWKDDELHMMFDNYGQRMMFYSISSRFISFVSDPNDKTSAA